MESPVAASSSSDASGEAGGSPWDIAEDHESIASGVNAVEAGWIASGFVVVARDATRLYDDDGILLATFAVERPVHGGIVDEAGGRVVVLDSAKYTVLDTDLEEVENGNLIEPCASGAAFGNDFVCSTLHLSGQTFYAYRLGGEGFLAMFEESYGPLKPLRRVPGRDEFLAVAPGLSPAEFELYEKRGGALTDLGTTPHHGDFAINSHYAFVGDPATHVVMPEGDILRIHADGGGCQPTNSTIPGENCLVRDGVLGLLPAGAEVYLDLRSGRDGALFGLAAFGVTPYSRDAKCGDRACAIQRMDVEGRRVESERQIRLGNRSEYNLYPHPDGRGVAIVGRDSDRWRTNDGEALSGAWVLYYVGIE